MRVGELLSQTVMPLFTWLTPRRLRPIQADAVAAAMIAALAAEGGDPVQVLESEQLQALAEQAASPTGSAQNST